MNNKFSLAAAFLGLSFGAGLFSVVVATLLLDTFKSGFAMLVLLLIAGVLLFVAGMFLGLKMFSGMGLI